ncbi:hypothetical protein [Haloplanus halobius]|uniref:hypothetical protein n=1 Tax=Haloplanus halobius TaxID=2934938 RepID=UPI00200C06C2|nr:hypothetical protein [Haloplanus sp. XH21]
MSVPESTPLARATTASLPALPDTLRTAASIAALPIQFVAFWVATLLPFTYLPLLATGMVTTHRVGFAALVGVNAVAFVVGHSHNSPE